VSEFDREASKIGRVWSTGGRGEERKKKRKKKKKKKHVPQV
jgi:hypothetical protein